MMGCDDMKLGNVGQQIGRLHNSICSMVAIVNTLREKIAPVLLEEAVPDGQPSMPYESMSPVGKELRMMEIEVESIIAEIDFVIKSIDL